MYDPTEDPELDNLAKRLKKCFAASKSEQMQKKYHPHPRFNTPEMWASIAENCRQSQADPDDFVDAAFMFCTIPGGPYPQNLAGGAGARWYNLYKKAESGNVKLPPGETVYMHKVNGLIKDCSLTAYRQALVHRRSVVDLLLDQYLIALHEFPAYLRVVLFPDNLALRNQWLHAAIVDLSSNPRLTETLRQMRFDLSWLPE